MLRLPVISWVTAPMLALAGGCGPTADEVGSAAQDTVAVTSGQGTEPRRTGAENAGEAGGDSGAGEAPPDADDGGRADGVGGVVDEGGAGGAAAPADPDQAALALPELPADYGLIKPPVPAPDPSELTLHALAGFEVVAVYSKPDLESKKLGYVRLGTRMKVTEKVEGPGCPGGFHGLPEGGYGCASKGLVVDRKPPFMKTSPPPPRLDQPYPYDWAYVRRWNSPMWWRIPTVAELALAEVERTKLEAIRTAQPVPDSGGAAPKPTPAPDKKASEKKPDGGEKKPEGSEGEKADGGEKTAEGADGGKPAGDKAEGGDKQADDEKNASGGDAPADDKDPPSDKPAKKDPPTDKPAQDDPPKDEPQEKDPAPVEPSDEPLAPPVKLPLNPSHPWLEKGYFISIAETVREEGKSYWHTARGAYVSQSDAYLYAPKDYSGHVFAENESWPFGFVSSKTATLYELGTDGKLARAGSVEKKQVIALTEEVEHGGKTYMTTVDGKLVRKDQLMIPELQPIPKGLKPYDRWIDVDLSDQTLVAYQGQRPVFATMVSTGKKGSAEESFQTPTGRFRIYNKQVTSTMDGTTATDGNYAIQDVPWVMYFEGSYALHGAFWHQSFGRVRSHGCVNLGPSDARWLFFWTTPFLPEGWHGVNAADESPGTTVIIHE